MADVSLHHVRKIYGSGPTAHVAVHEFDLHVADGEFLVLVGPSGCGKSTILRMIAGLEAISDGTLHIGGERMNETAPGERDIAMVFQTYALYPHMTVEQNLGFALRMRQRATDMSDADLRARVQAAAQAMHIESLLPRFPRALSGGERQRVALGRALVRQPRVFLFDEPLSNLDARLRVQMRREIARLHRELGTTMIYVTHDQVEAMTLGDRIVVLRDGRVQQVDTPAALYATPHTVFVAGFIGSPAMNLMRGTVSTTRVTAADWLDIAIPATWHTALTPYAGRDVLLGVRPEHLSITDGTTAADLSMRIELIEHLGNDSIAHGVAGTADIAVRCGPRHALDAGAHVKLVADASHLHFFDPDTERRILR